MAALSRIVSQTLASHWRRPGQLTQHWAPIGRAGRQMIQDMSGGDTMAVWPHIHRHLIAAVTQWPDTQIISTLYRYN